MNETLNPKRFQSKNPYPPFLIRNMILCVQAVSHHAPRRHHNGSERGKVVVHRFFAVVVVVLLRARGGKVGQSDERFGFGTDDDG